MMTSLLTGSVGNPTVMKDTLESKQKRQGAPARPADARNRRRIRRRGAGKKGVLLGKFERRVAEKGTSIVIAAALTIPVPATPQRVALSHPPAERTIAMAAQRRTPRTAKVRIIRSRRGPAQKGRVRTVRQSIKKDQKIVLPWCTEAHWRRTRRRRL